LDEEREVFLDDCLYDAAVDGGQVDAEEGAGDEEGGEDK
jgi:hypothetical protein